MKITNAGDTLVFSGLTPEESKRIIAAAKNKPSAKPRLITYKEAAEMLGVCTESVKRFAKRGWLHPVRFSNQFVRLHESEVIEAAQNGFHPR